MLSSQKKYPSREIQPHRSELFSLYQQDSFGNLLYIDPTTKKGYNLTRSTMDHCLIDAYEEL